MSYPELSRIPLYEYRIVIPAKAGETEKVCADEIVRFALLKTGITLPVVSDSEPEVGCEILIGSTDRAFSAETAAGLGRGEYAVRIGCRCAAVTGGCDGSLMAGTDALIAALSAGEAAEGFGHRAPEAVVPYRGSEVYRNCAFGRALAALRLTGDVRRDILAIAYSQLGYSEGVGPGDYSGTGGTNSDITEFGLWYGKMGMWCQMFASFCVLHAGVPTSAYRKASWTVRALRHLIEQERAYTRAEVEEGKYTPRPADIIYFKSKRNDYITNHVGIVVRYENGVVYTIEGNARLPGETVHRGRVVEKRYEISDPYIVYIGCPDYEAYSRA